MPNLLRHHQDTATELFGASTERSEFERSARARADEPQTAAVFIPSAITGVLLTLALGC